MNLRETFKTFESYTDSDISQITEGSKFKDTMVPWNHLNKPISIGQCLHLYKLLGATDVHDFAIRYLESGEELCTLLNERPKTEHRILKRLHGRTEDEFLVVADKFLNKLDSNLYSLEDVILYMWIRMFYQTSIGFQREVQTQRALKIQYPEFQFKESSAELDLEYGIDLECYQGSQLICGIQVKPESYYFGQSPNTQSAKFQNAVKHQRYSNVYQVPVTYAIATSSGELVKVYTSTEPRTFHQFDYDHPELEQFNPFN